MLGNKEGGWQGRAWAEVRRQRCVCMCVTCPDTLDLAGETHSRLAWVGGEQIRGERGP